MCKPATFMARRERAARHPAVTELVSILNALDAVRGRLDAWLETHDVDADYTAGLQALDTLAKSDPKTPYEVSPYVLPAVRALAWTIEMGHSSIECNIPGGFGLLEAA